MGQAIVVCGLSFIADDKRHKPIACPTGYSAHMIIRRGGDYDAGACPEPACPRR